MGIILLSTPITVDIGEWMMNNIGKGAAAKRDPNTTTATIYAVENADSASSQMVRYARENNAMILVGLSENEENAID